MPRVWNSTIQRYSRPKRGPSRRIKRRRAQGKIYGTYHDFCATLPCVVGFYCMGKVAGHHTKSVGAGGKDYGQEVSLCTLHHQAVHTLGRTQFEARFRVDLDVEAESVRKLWEQR